MNYCKLGGFLIYGGMEMPADPVDYDDPLLNVIGCNRLRCDTCKAAVRSAVGLAPDRKGKVDVKVLYDTVDLATSPLLTRAEGSRSRLYFCRCDWLEESVGSRALDDPDPIPVYPPGVSWHCAGHPVAELPHEFDGLKVTGDNLTRVVTDYLRGLLALSVRAQDRPGALWVARLHSRLAQTPWPDEVTRAAAGCLDDGDPRARARALDFVRVLHPPPGMQRALELFESQRSLFADVPDPITRVKGDKTLEDSLWRAVEPLIQTPGRARELARAEALAAGHGRMALYAALASGDPAWMAEHAEEVFRATPEVGDRLVIAFKYCLPPDVPSAPVLARLGALLAARAGREKH